METCPGTVASSSNGILVDEVGDYFSKLFPCLIFKVLSAQQNFRFFSFFCLCVEQIEVNSLRFHIEGV